MNRISLATAIDLNAKDFHDYAKNNNINPVWNELAD